jgi:hypothetical protein
MTEAYEEEAVQPRKRGVLERLHATRLPLWVSLLLALLLVAVLVWSHVSIGSAEARLEKTRQELAQGFESDRAALRAQWGNYLASQDDEAQRRFGMALGWAVRGELIRNNLDQVDQFFNEIVRLGRIERIVLASPDGKLLLSSDKRYQGGDFAALYPAELLGAPRVTVLTGAGGKKRLVVPVMGLTARLGTVVMDYAPVPAPGS